MLLDLGRGVLAQLSTYYILCNQYASKISLLPKAQAGNTNPTTPLAYNLCRGAMRNAMQNERHNNMENKSVKHKVYLHLFYIQSIYYIYIERQRVYDHFIFNRYICLIQYIRS